MNELSGNALFEAVKEKSNHALSVCELGSGRYKLAQLTYFNWLLEEKKIDVQWRDAGREICRATSLSNTGIATFADGKTPVEAVFRCYLVMNE